MNEQDGCHLVDKKGKTLFTGREYEGLYYFHCSVHHVEKGRYPLHPSAAFFGLPLSGHIKASGDDFAKKLTETHCALGHMHYNKVRKLYSLKPGENPDCPTCVIANMKKSAAATKPPERSKRPCHRIHLDLFFTEGSNNPCQLALDDFTDVSYLDLLNDKGECLEKWIELKASLENKHFPAKFAFVKTDNEFVYTSNLWIAHCKDCGLEHEFSARYRHDDNGKIERAIGVVGSSFRCLMIQGGAPDSDIPNALVHANMIRNNTPSDSNGGRTPKEKEAGMKLGINARLLKGPIFCLCYAMIYDDEGRRKHGDRGIACVYLGYDDRNNQYKVKEWVSGRIYYTGDGKMFPHIFPYRASPSVAQGWISEMDALAPSQPVSQDNPAPHAMPTGPRRSHRQRDYIFSGGRDLRDIPDLPPVRDLRDIPDLPPAPSPVPLPPIGEGNLSDRTQSVPASSGILVPRGAITAPQTSSSSRTCGGNAQIYGKRQRFTQFAPSSPCTCGLDVLLLRPSIW